MYVVHIALLVFLFFHMYHYMHKVGDYATFLKGELDRDEGSRGDNGGGCAIPGRWYSHCLDSLFAISHTFTTTASVFLKVKYYSCETDRMIFSLF